MASDSLFFFFILTNCIPSVVRCASMRIGFYVMWTETACIIMRFVRSLVDVIKIWTGVDRP